MRVCVWVYLWALPTESKIYSFIQMYNLLLALGNRSPYPNITFSHLPGIPAKKKKNCTSHPEQGDLSWQDIIGLQSSFHRKFNAWHASAWVGQACRWRWRWSCGSLLPIVVSGICKGHLQEALDMTSSGSICIPWLLFGLNITDAFQTSGATGHFRSEATKLTHTGKNH